MPPAMRSGADRREGWGPQCERHDDLLDAINRAAVATEGLTRDIRWILRIGSGIFAVVLALLPLVWGAHTRTTEAAQDIATARIELKTYGAENRARIEALEQCLKPDTKP